MNNDYNQNPNMVPNTNPVVVPTTEPVTGPMIMPEVVTTPVVMENPTIPPVMPVPTEISTDPNKIVNENLKQVEIKEYTPPSKFKIVLLIIFFLLLVGFILFLPDITALIDKYKSGNINYTKEEITTGKLICTLSSNTTNLDKNYSWRFIFSENKLESVRMELTTRGDVTADKETLSEIAEKCKTLESETNSINGVTVRCDIYDDRVIETQSFNLEIIDDKELASAYSEAGGVNPGYKYNQDISIIEKNMNASGYSCKKEK